MKYLILIACMFLVGCSPEQSNSTKETESKKFIVAKEVNYHSPGRPNFIDNCEYVVHCKGYGSSMIHKQNCVFCLKRKSKRMR
jgi:hypothetical protein